jgi:hypothetical protein
MQVKLSKMIEFAIGGCKQIQKKSTKSSGVFDFFQPGYPFSLL